jgi:hypothetical protein
MKAIEALGRLRDPQAMEPLLHLLTERHWLRWTQPEEIRVAAMQALAHIEPARATEFQRRSGLRPEQVRNAALVAAADESNWIRQRRYPRIVPDKTVPAMATTRRHSSGLEITSLSLGGGLATSDSALPPSSEASLLVRAGLRPIRAQVMVREAGRKQVAFEIMDMDLQDRTRLRGLLSQLNTTERMARAPRPAIARATR